jgi:putative DNA primase/helicase
MSHLLTKPKTISFNAAGLPRELSIDRDTLEPRRRFVGWRWKWIPPEPGRAGRWTKVPVDPQTGNLAATDNPATWGTRAEAIEGALRYGCDGVGVVFAAGDAYFGIDLDRATDDTGELAPDARATVERFPDIYWETSVRGRGLHGIGCTRQVPHEGTGNKRGGTECYWRGRFFCLSGHSLAGYGAPNGIADCTDELIAWHAETFPAKSTPVATPRAPALTIDDDAALTNARRMPGFVALFDHGDLSAYGGDHSRADVGLLNYLVVAGVTDPAQLDRLHRASPLARGKWGATRGDTTYGARTIAFALNGHVQPFDGWATTPVERPIRQERQVAAAGASAPAEPVPDGAGCDLQLAIAHRRIQALETENAALRAEAETYRNRATQSEEIMSRTVSVLGNDRLGQERFTALALAQELGCRRPDDDGWVRLPREAIGARVGMSADTVSRHTTKLVKLGLVEKRLERLDEEVNQQTGEIIPARTITLYRLPEAVGGTVTGFQDAVATADPDQPKAWGGSRTACPDHPHAGTIKRWAIHCAEATCNRVLDTGEEPIQNQERQLAATARVAHVNQPRNQERQVAAAGFTTESPPDSGPASVGTHTPAVASSSAANRQGWPRVAGAAPAPAHIYEDTGTTIAAAWQRGQALPGFEPAPPLDVRTDISYGARRP